MAKPNVPNPFAADIVSRLGVCSTSSLLLLLSDDIADDVIVAGNMPSSNVAGPADVVDVVVVNGILTVVGFPGRLVVLTTALADMVDGLLVTLFFVPTVVGANVGWRVVAVGRVGFEVVVVVFLVVVVVHVGLLVGGFVMPLLVVVDTGLVGLKKS